MKKVISLALTVIMLFSFSACNKTIDSESSKEKSTPEEWVKPPQDTFSEEEQRIIDTRYLELCERFTSFSKIPREMLRVTAVSTDYVWFSFYLGGLRTGCTFIWSIPDKDSTVWYEKRENEFKKYYEKGFTVEEMEQIYSMLFDQIKKDVCIDLDGKLEDYVFQENLEWEIRNDKLFLKAYFWVRQPQDILIHGNVEVQVNEP